MWGAAAGSPQLALLHSADHKTPIRMSRASEMTTTESQIELDLLAKLGDLRNILHDFLNRYPFNPELFPAVAEEVPA